MFEQLTCFRVLVPLQQRAGGRQAMQTDGRGDLDNHVPQQEGLLRRNSSL